MKLNKDNKCFDLYEDVKYEDDALIIAFVLQNKLQNYLGQKRGNVTPEGNFSTFDKIKESLYFYNCIIAEEYELYERIENYIQNSIETAYNLRKNFIKNKYSAEILEIHFEYIDIFHFIMNCGLYLGIKRFNNNLECIYKEKYINSGYTYNLIYHFNMIDYYWGKILENIPYKIWKKYNTYKFDKAIIYNCYYEMFKHFITIGDILGIDKERFYSLYICKNKHNFDRQKKGGKYHR